MDGRSTLILTTLALLGTALTGCIAPGLTQNSTDVEVPALAVRPAADAAAASWSPGAKLVGVFALESAEAHEPFPADLVPGNGLAPVWNFAYVSPEGAPRAFMAFADGTVRSENETYGAEQYAGQAEPLHDLDVDSDVALETAALDATFGEALRGENVTLAQGVAHMEGTMGWYFAAMSEAGGAIAVVDATSGELLWTQPFDMPSMDLGMYAAEGFAYRPVEEPTHVEATGRLDGGQPSFEVPFHVDGFGDEARLTIAIVPERTTDTLRWTLVKVDGEEEDAIDSGGFGLTPFSPEERTWDLELDGPGAYRLDLEYASAALVKIGSVTYALTLDAGLLEHADEDHEDDA